MRELERARSGNLFGTPLLSHMWADGTELNLQLHESILEYERRHPGRTRTNVGGWHSEPGMLECCEGVGQRLIRHMSDMIEEATRRLYASVPGPTSTGKVILTRCTPIPVQPGQGFITSIVGSRIPTPKPRPSLFTTRTQRAPMSSSPSCRRRTSCSSRSPG